MVCKGFFAEVHEFKGFVRTREEVMDDYYTSHIHMYIYIYIRLEARSCLYAHNPHTYTECDSQMERFEKLAKINQFLSMWFFRRLVMCKCGNSMCT